MENARNPSCDYMRSSNDAKLTTLSTDEKTALAEQPLVKVFPSPAKRFVYVDLQNNLAEQVTYQMLDVNGKVFKKGVFKDKRTAIDISTLPAGFYVIKTSVGVAKFLKQ